MDEIELKLDEDNELLFQVVIEGAREKPTAIRFVCDDGDVSYMFKGSNGSEPGEVKINVPAMLSKLKEGSYESRLEVLVDGKHIVPLELKTRFNRSLSVVAEAVKVVKKQELKVTARPVTLKDRYQAKTTVKK